MPVFEYQCKSCSSRYEVFHKSTLKQEEVSCPSCNSKENKKLFSSFSANVSSSGDYSAGSCSSGNCDVPSSGGCASGMCGLN